MTVANEPPDDSHDRTNVDDVSDLLDEADRILHSVTFNNAATMRGLLQYLVDRFRDGTADTLKSYVVAVDGLGRDPDFDAKFDSYPRVQLARLREMLARYYNREGADSPYVLIIPKGGFKLRFVQNAAVSKIVVPEDSANRPVPVRHLALLAPTMVLLFTLIVAAALAAWYQLGAEAISSAYDDENFPIVIIGAFETQDSPPRYAAFARSFRNELLAKLSTYDAISVLGTDDDRQEGEGKYNLTADIAYDGAKIDISLNLERMSDGAIIWSRSDEFEGASIENFDVENYSLLTAAAIAQNQGAIHSDQRTLDDVPESPYRCWLNVTEYFQDREFVQIGNASSCTRQWYDACPNCVLAVSLRSWMLSNRALFLPPAERATRMTVVRDLAEKAMSLNPNSAIALSARMNVALQLGDTSIVRQTATALQQQHSSDPDMLALASIHLILIGDRSARALLEEAISRHPNPAPWYHLVLALHYLREDMPDRANTALDSMGSEAIPSLYWLFKFEIYSRQQDEGRAEAAWSNAAAAFPSLATRPVATLCTLPLSTAMSEEIQGWIIPRLEAVALNHGFPVSEEMLHCDTADQAL